MNRPLRIRLRSIRSLLLCLALLGAAFTAPAAGLFVSVNIAPPPIPVYAQPLCPGPGYIWVPGYWAWGPYGFYWVPGTWVLAPFIGALWTPGYWGWDGAVYVWHTGYWGRHVGFYGGIDYGFGYFGTGYTGGYWNHGAFYYNATVNRVDTRVVHNVYRRSVVHAASGPRVSFNGGRGGTTTRPTAAERTAAREVHRSATPAQLRHQQPARGEAPQARTGGPPRVASEARRAAPPMASHSGGLERREPNAIRSSPALQPRRIERGYPQANVRGAPPQQAMRPPQARAQHPQTLAMPRQPMRPEGMTRPRGPTAQAPRAEMHAQNMARPQGQPRGGRGGGREERRGG